MLGVLVVAGLATGGSSQFVKVSPDCGITAVHQPSGPFIFSLFNYAPMTAGGLVGDFNRDGFQDIFVICSGAHPDALYINNGDGSFTDRAAEWGVAVPHMGLGGAVGDFDRDGWPDIFVTSLGLASQQPGAGRHRLYRNNGDGSFTEVAAQAGVNFFSPADPDGFGASFGDVNLDGHLDLFAASWASNTQGNRLKMNNGDGTFTDASGSGGMIQVPNNTRGFMPTITDVTGDGWPDILLAADFRTSKGYTSISGQSFIDTTSPMGLGKDENGMGAAVGDLTGDGLPDYFVTSIHSDFPGSPGVPGSGNMLYINQGNGVFTEESLARGVKYGWWGWGTVFVDLDNDTDLDIVMVNGWNGSNPSGIQEWINRPMQVYINDGQGFFTESATELGLDYISEGRGLSTLDYDNDGAMDLVVFSYLGQVALFRNQLDTEQNRYLRIALDTTRHSCLAPDGYHTTVRARTGEKEQIRTLHGGAGYLSQSESLLHFGLGPALVVNELIIEWANGEVTVMTEVSTNQLLTIEATFPGDVNRDGVVDMADLGALLDEFGATGDALPADFDGNGVVDTRDLAALLGRYGASCLVEVKGSDPAD